MCSPVSLVDRVVDCAALCINLLRLGLNCIWRCWRVSLSPWQLQFIPSCSAPIAHSCCSVLASDSSLLFCANLALGTAIREFGKASTGLSLKVGSDSFHSPWLLRCRCVCPGSTSTQLTCEPIFGLGLCFPSHLPLSKKPFAGY